jgi:hypothetical protein
MQEPTSRREAAALGMIERVEELHVADPPTTHEDLDEAFSQACQGRPATDGCAAAIARRGHRREARLRNGTPLDIAGGPDTRRGQLVASLREHGATATTEPQTNS